MSPLEFVTQFLQDNMPYHEEVVFIFQLYKNSQNVNKIIETLFLQIEDYQIIGLLGHGPNIAFQYIEKYWHSFKQNSLVFSVLNQQDPTSVFRQIQGINGYAIQSECPDPSQQLIILFEMMKNNEYKYKPGQITICRIKYPKRINMQPNQDIVIGKMTDSLLPIDSKYTIFYNYAHSYKIKQLQRWNQKLYNEPQAITYQGSLDVQGLEQGEDGTLLLGTQISYQGQFKEGVINGKGKLQLQYGYLEGDFQNGYAHGKCKDQYGEGEYYYNSRHGEYKDNYKNVSYYEDAQQVQYQVKGRDVKAMLYIANQNQNYIDNFCLRTLLPNQWLQMKIVDYYLDAVQLQQKLNIKIINTCEAQDIFGSLIERNQFSKEVKINPEQYNRIILVININRNHFITIAYENYKFYVFDSLGQNYFDLLDNLREVMGLSSQTQIEIITARKIKQLKQDNSYDCGLHALFNAYKLYTIKAIENIDFAPIVNMKNIRKQIKLIVEDNYASLDIL